jgi:hypothetical protein
MIEVLIYLYQHMNCKPLQTWTINQQLVDLLFDIFDFVPTWVKDSMLRMVKVMLQVENYELIDHVLDTQAFLKVFETLEVTQKNKNMLYSTCWNILKEVVRIKNK